MPLGALGAATRTHASSVECLDRSLALGGNVGCGSSASIHGCDEFSKVRSKLSGSKVHPRCRVVLAIIRAHDCASCFR